MEDVVMTGYKCDCGLTHPFGYECDKSGKNKINPVFLRLSDFSAYTVSDFPNTIPPVYYIELIKDDNHVVSIKFSDKKSRDREFSKIVKKIHDNDNIVGTHAEKA